MCVNGQLPEGFNPSKTTERTHMKLDTIFHLSGVNVIRGVCVVIKRNSVNVCVCVCVCFNNSETAGFTDGKLGTIPHPTERVLQKV